MKKTQSTQLKALSLTLGMAILFYQSGVKANPLYEFIKGYEIAQQTSDDIIIDTNDSQIPPPPPRIPLTVTPVFGVKWMGEPIK